MNGIAGWITIGTKLDNKNLSAQLREQKRELQKYAREQEQLLKQKVKIEADLSQIETARSVLEKLRDEDLAMARTESERSRILEEYNQKVELLNLGYKATNEELDKTNRKLAINAQNASMVRGQITQIENEIKRSKGWDSIEKSIKNSSKALSGTIRKMGKYALAVFGIRGAYSMITRAISTISQYDKQVAKDMEYIRYALTATIKPVVEWIVKAIYQVLMAVRNLIRSFTGFNIFSNASAKNMKSIAKSAKDAGKSLAAFDEANILNDNSRGEIAPSFDLSADNIFAGMDLNYFIAKGKEIATNLANGINNFFKNTNWKEVANFISTGLKGAIDIVTTFVKEIDWNQVGQSIADFLLEFDWLGLGESLFDLLINGMIGVIDLVAGVTEKIIKKLEDPKFWEDLKKSGAKMADKIVEGLATIGKKVMDVFNKIETWLETTVVNKLTDIFGNNIAQAIMTPIRVIFNWLKTFIGERIKGLMLIFSGLSDFLNGDWKTGLKKVLAGILTIMLAPINAMISGINAVIKGLNKISIDIPNWVPVYGGKKFGFNLKSIPKIDPKNWLASGGIVDVPRTGVQLGNARVGEAGREGVLPFERPGVMQEFGREVGKWVTVNIDLTNTIDGRILNRRLEQISANNQFARNGVR